MFGKRGISLMFSPVRCKWDGKIKFPRIMWYSNATGECCYLGEFRTLKLMLQDARWIANNAPVVG